MDVKGLNPLLFFLVVVSAVLYGSPAVAQCELSGLDARYSSTDSPVSLTGTPSGGNFAGPGISGNTFDPAAAGAGTHTITYTNTTDYSVSRSGSFSPVSSESGWTTVPSSSGGALAEVDNGLSPAIDIGFSFHFFGAEYTQLYASSNGDVVFTPYNPDPWNTAVIPRSSAPNNMIALVRTDLKAESPVKGEIKYRVDGTAPNRVFILNYEYVDPRDPNAEGYGETPDVITQLKLFETTQDIEIHTTHNGADRQSSVQGIENADGSRAYFVPGRNFGFWTNRDNDFVSFTACSDSQTVTVDGTYTVGGTVRGLANGNELVLQNNGGDDLTVTDNGNFTFASALEDGTDYNVTISRQPNSPNQTCAVAEGRGTLAGSPVTNVVVDCDTSTHTLTYSAGANGRIDGTSPQEVENEGDGSEVRAVPNTGYRFDGWSDGSTQNPRIDTNVTADIDVVAVFIADGTDPAPEPEPEPDTGNPNTDENPPRIDAETSQSIHATGLVMAASDLPAPDATDAEDGAVPVTVASEQSLFRPGTHELTWAAEDAAGNRAETSQRLRIHPIISLAKDQEQPEGGQAQVRFLLNGYAPEYPLTVGYSLGGTADSSDHDLTAGTVTFEEGELEQELVVNIAGDAVRDASETIIISLDAATTTEGAANFGSKQEHTITIAEGNLLPVVDIAVYQDGRRTQLISQDGGEVTIAATVTDPNPEDTHSFQWQIPSHMVATEVDTTTQTIDAASMDVGLHHVEVTVTEDGPAARSAHDRKAILVSETRPTLAGNEDSDGDGIDDLTEGDSDTDGDGQPDYLDPIAQSNVVSGTAADGFMFLIEADPGVRFELGDVALQYGADGAGLTQAELAEGDDPALGSDNISNVGGYADFILREVPLGGTAHVVIPQRKAVPEGAVYRKFSNGLWTNFEEGAEDTVASAPGAEGVCPPPGSSDYRPGLTPGDWCVRITLSDGGPNDADGQANGVIVDPSGTGASAGPSELKTEGGGGSLGAGGLLVLALVRLLGGQLRFLRGRRGHVGHGAHRPLPVFMVLSAVAVLASPPQANANELITAYDPFYLSTSLGYVNTNISNSDLDSRFAADGHSVQTLSTDAGRLGWSLGIGYRATNRFSFEVDYINLGEVEMTFVADPAANGLANVYPESGHGGAISTVYRHPLTRRFGAEVRAGVFIWEGEFATFQDSAWVGESQGRNEDLFYGLGVDYILSPALSVGSQIQRFEFDTEPTHVVALNLKFRYMEWLDRF